MQTLIEQRDKDMRITALNTELMDLLSGIQDDIDALETHIFNHEENPELYNYEMLKDFLSSVQNEAVKALHRADNLRKEVKVR